MGAYEDHFWCKPLYLARWITSGFLYLCVLFRRHLISSLKQLTITNSLQTVAATGSCLDTVMCTATCHKCLREKYVCRNWDHVFLWIFTDNCILIFCWKSYFFFPTCHTIICHIINGSEEVNNLSGNKLQMKGDLGGKQLPKDICGDSSGWTSLQSMIFLIRPRM